MSDINSFFPGKYIKASDLNGKPLVITITSFGIEKVGDDDKPVLRFEGSTQGLVVNKTNAMSLGAILGNDTSMWLGMRVELYPTKVQFNVNMVDATRIRAVGEGTEEDPFA